MAHRSDATSRFANGRARVAWLRELWQQQLPFLFEMLERCRTVAQANEAERKWVAIGRIEGWPLTNRQRGGGGGWTREQFRAQRRVISRTSEHPLTRSSDQA